MRGVRVFEKFVLRKMFVPKANEVKTDRGNFITTSFMIGTPRQMLKCNQMEEDDMGQACSMYGMKRKKSVLAGKSEGKRPLRKLIIRWGYDIKMDIKKYPADHNGCAV
jgi:hypothetical protein